MPRNADRLDEYARLIRQDTGEVRADGRYCPFLTRVFPVKESQGHVIYWVGTNTDIAEIRKAQDELLEFNTTLEQRVRERTVMLKAFSDSVAHDLRTEMHRTSANLSALADTVITELRRRDDRFYVGRRMMVTEPIILLVEDNPDDAELTRIALDEAHVSNQLIIVRDGQEALDWLFCAGTHAGREPCLVPSLVLLDLKLPKIGGLEVLQQLRADERTRRLPVVILTSSKEEQDVIRGYNLGANSYIQKPVDYSQFLEAIRQLGVYWMVLNEPPPPATKKA